MAGVLLMMALLWASFNILTVESLVWLTVSLIMLMNSGSVTVSRVRSWHAEMRISAVWGMIKLTGAILGWERRFCLHLLVLGKSGRTKSGFEGGEVSTFSFLTSSLQRDVCLCTTIIPRKKTNTRYLNTWQICTRASSTCHSSCCPSSAGGLGSLVSCCQGKTQTSESRDQDTRHPGPGQTRLPGFSAQNKKPYHCSQCRPCL